MDNKIFPYPPTIEGKPAKVTRHVHTDMERRLGDLLKALQAGNISETGALIDSGALRREEFPDGSSLDLGGSCTSPDEE